MTEIDVKIDKAGIYLVLETESSSCNAKILRTLNNMGCAIVTSQNGYTIAKILLRSFGEDE